MTQAIAYIDILIQEIQTAENTDKETAMFLSRLQELRSLIQPEKHSTQRVPECGKHLVGLITDDFNDPVEEMIPYS